MQLAQKLYEGVQLSDAKAAGLITYIRTDGLHVGITLAAWMFLCGVPGYFMKCFIISSDACWWLIFFYFILFYKFFIFYKKSDLSTFCDDQIYI